MIIQALIIIIVFYFVFGLVLFFTQKSMLYYPSKQDFNQCAGFYGYEKLSYNGTRFYYKKGLTNNVIVYYHGNAGSACDRSYIKSIFEKTNASLVFVEYAGYSNDKRSPSKKLILKDVENIHNYIKNNSYEKVLIYGQSIGSGAASYHAYLGGVDSLILTTSFSKLGDVAKSKYLFYPTSILLKEEYDNLNWLKNYKGNIVLIHGDKDSIIPYRFSKKLFDKLDIKNKEYILIKGKGHNDIWGSSDFQNSLKLKLMENIGKDK